MALTPRLGFTSIPTLAPERLVGLARSVEAAGFDDLWVWEDCFKQSAIASAGVALAVTEKITVGIGLMPTPLRNVALCAMELANLARMFPGRLIGGIGHGVQEWMDQVGARAASPLTLLDEYATVLRQLLDGETVTTKGDYVNLDRVALDWPPTVVPPLMIGASGPKSVRLAARLGDGNLLTNALTDAQLADITHAVADVRGPGHPVVTTLIVATGPDAEARWTAELPLWGAEADPTIGAYGGAETIAAVIDRVTGLGATSVVIQPTEDEPDLDGFIAFIGREVRPLLGSSSDSVG